LLTWMHVRETRGEAGARGPAKKVPLVPGFVIGFLLMAVLRSIGDATLTSAGAAYGLFDAAAWNGLTSNIGNFWASQVLLGTAMAAVGLNTNFAVFKGVGLEPFAVGLGGALAVGAAGLGMAVLLGPFVKL